MLDKNIRVVLTGGVSGGHTFPLIAVAQAIAKQSSIPVEFLFIGARGKIEETAMKDAGIKTQYISFGKWRRYFSFQNFIDIFKLPLGFFQALWHLFFFMPDAIFSKGGSASVPLVLAARMYRIPVLIHDSDAVAGLANKILSRFVQRIAVAYEGAFQFFPVEKTALTGNPVRKEVMEGTIPAGLEMFRFRADAPVILIMGGSLGARVLNEHILKILPELLEKGYQVAHITGQKNYEEILTAAKEYGLDSEAGPYRPLPFIQATPLAHLYAIAHVVIARAGAGTIAELAANKKASILVPLQSAANNEQRMNAYELAQYGAAEVLEEPNLTEHILIQNIEEILHDALLREKMGNALHRFYHPDAAEKIAVAVLELATV